MIRSYPIVSSSHSSRIGLVMIAVTRLMRAKSRRIWDGNLERHLKLVFGRPLNGIWQMKIGSRK